MSLSAKHLSRLALVFGVLSVVAALWGAVALVQSQNPTPILLVGVLAMMTGGAGLMAQRKRAEEEQEAA